MNTSQKIDLLLERLDGLEKLIRLQNPALQVSVDEKVAILQAARKTGDKKKIKAALIKINGRA